MSKRRNIKKWIGNMKQKNWIGNTYRFPVFNFTEMDKKEYNSKVRRKHKQQLRTAIINDNLEDLQFSDPKEIINDYDYCDISCRYEPLYEINKQDICDGEKMTGEHDKHFF